MDLETAYNDHSLILTQKAVVTFKPVLMQRNLKILPVFQNQTEITAFM